MIDEKGILNLIDNFQVYDNRTVTQLVMQYTRLKGDVDKFSDDKTIYALVGPSGSGKSTFIANMYTNGLLGNPNEGTFVPFINRFFADEPITLTEETAYKRKLLREGKSFMLESAQFDEKYAEFIKEMKIKYGYKVCLIYLTKWHPKENISMVQKRKCQGGHGRKSIELNEQTIEKMYEQDSKNLVEVMPYCDSCFVVNNQTVELGQEQTIKPVLLLHKKLNGTFDYDKAEKNACFLYSRILKHAARPKFNLRVDAPKPPRIFISYRSSTTRKIFTFIPNPQLPVYSRIEDILPTLKDPLAKLGIDPITGKKR